MKWPRGPDDAGDMIEDGEFGALSEAKAEFSESWIEDLNGCVGERWQRLPAELALPFNVQIFKPNLNGR